MPASTLAALAAILFGAAVPAAATLLNLRALDAEVPADFRRIYDAARYRRSQEYTRATARLGLVADAVELAGLLGVWFAGGFARLDAAVRVLGWGLVPTGLCYFAALAVGAALFGLPFRWWRTFVLEERFGFNRTSPRTFWRDQLTAALLAAALGGPLAAAALWLFASGGGHAWLWCWGVATAWSACVHWVAPTWILPLFNRFTPLADGALRDAILAYAGSVGFPAGGVYLIDGSRRSTKANAFFTGFGRHRRIALFDTLVAGLAPEEVLAVVAHEVGHYRRRHVPIAFALGIAQMGVVLFLLARALHWEPLFSAFFVPVPSTYVGMVLFALVLAPLDVLLSLPLHALSRRHEYQADAFAVATTGRAQALATALERLAAESLADLTPHPAYVALRYSHPPVRARVGRLRAAAATRV